ncbi:hypothetical protein HNQ77_002173 [Silvibacterium bohemicum]|uniref:Uncharacterized protein n=1 Tax=Silvibacterium bohemicum TaxID=1577686 RepID=A0A841JZ37_9BACT|nr:hypothetical protein [Silvibacterium bohemicum]MBB6144221.1 hypothetical protein [Silvibacterium bohemicum]
MFRQLAASYLVWAASVVFGQATQVTPDGKLLTLGQYCYTITAPNQGVPKPIGITFQSITREQVLGVDALAIVVHQHLYSGKFDMRDSFLLRRDDLRPIRLDTDFNGSPHVHLDYSDRHISGWKMAGATKQPIDIAINGPVWDGNLWGETFAALPLTAGASMTLPVYQYNSGLGTFYVDALGQHEEHTPWGTFQGWRVKAGLSHSEQVEYTVSTHPGLEISYTAGPSSQRIGGDCGALQ